jgi:hypothetical protein
MERDFEKCPDGFNKVIFRMQAASERDQMLGVFHDPVPATHELKACWEDDMRLSFQLVPKSSPAHDKAGKPDAMADPAVQERRVTLMAMDEKDLHTRAGELGVTVGKRSRGQLVAAMLAVEFKPAAAAAD